jgi:hypothetical protein
MKTKDEVAKLSIRLNNRIQKDRGVAVKYIRCDNAGENRSLQEEIIDFPVIKCKFEFTTPDLPQQNGKIEETIPLLHYFGPLISNLLPCTGFLHQSL